MKQDKRNNSNTSIPNLNTISWEEFKSSLKQVIMEAIRDSEGKLTIVKTLRKISRNEACEELGITRQTLRAWERNTQRNQIISPFIYPNGKRTSIEIEGMREVMAKWPQLFRFKR